MKKYLVRALVTYAVEREIKANSKVEALGLIDENEFKGLRSNVCEVEIDHVRALPLPGKEVP